MKFSFKEKQPDNTDTRYAKFFKNLTFLTACVCTRMCAWQGVRDVSFSENFALALNE